MATTPTTTIPPGAQRANAAADAQREFAGLIMHLLSRRAEGIAAPGIDERLARALEQPPEAQELLQRVLRRARRLPQGRREELFSTAFAAAPITAQIDPERLAGIARRARVTVPPIVAGATRQAYGVVFDNLRCIDESNPEFPGSDEPYVVFGVLTQAQADAGQAGRALRTPIYENVDDGDRRPASGSQNLRLFGPAGAATIGDGVLISAACFEHDLGDAAEIVALVGDVLTAVGAVAGELGIELVALVAGALAAIAGMIASWGQDDPVGAPAGLALTQAAADDRTSNGPATERLRFDGGSVEGIYDATLVLRRA